jgi:beta-mannosidase
VRRLKLDAGELSELSDGWLVASTPPGERETPGALSDLDSVPAQVPGTAAGALADAGRRWSLDDPRELDGRDWWFWTSFSSPPVADGEELHLWFDGLATVADVYLDGERILRSESMFERHCVAIEPPAPGEHELAICCRALDPLLRVRRKPRARWRTRLVSEPNLRFFRTMLLGRAPGFAPGPAVVGPWRGVVLERRRSLAASELTLRARVEDGAGVLTARATLRTLPASTGLDSVQLRLTGPGGTRTAELACETVAGGVRVSGELVLEEVELWWPHTHGQPCTYGAELRVRAGGSESTIDAGRVGFRHLEARGELERDGLGLRVNGVPVFARGAVWTPLDLFAPHASEDRLRRALGLVVEAGMNMLRVPGIACYESSTFYDLCDELGILVWQDFMFANLDYPEQDADFMRTVEAEAREVLEELGARPSLAVVCGGSEVAQQVAMMGLDPGLANGPLYGELLPRLVAEAGVQAPYVPSTPWGGDLPFRPDRGVANYYGVGAYLRPLQDARLSEVRFAAECLAFANVPDDSALECFEAPGELVVHHPRWKQGVPRDAGAGWDFEDVRDHYLALLFEVDPVQLRSVDNKRYLELSRQVSGEVMAEVFGEWRRAGSTCAGGLVLWLSDLQPGAGWGVLDHRGEPKVAFHHLRRALAPVAVWSTDEGLGGVHVHVVNERPRELAASLRVSLYRDLETRVEEASTEIVLAPRGSRTLNVEQLLGRFVDASWAYRFGPPGHDLIVFSLEQRRAGGPAEILSQACRFPLAHPSRRQPASRLGLSAAVRTGAEGDALVTITSAHFLYGARVAIPGFVPDDDAFLVEPGHPKAVRMRRSSDGAAPAGRGDGAAPAGGSLTALNLAGRVQIDAEVGE